MQIPKPTSADIERFRASVPADPCGQRAMTGRLDDAAISWVDAGEARLKGLAQPVR